MPVSFTSMMLGLVLIAALVGLVAQYRRVKTLRGRLKSARRRAEQAFGCLELATDGYYGWLHDGLGTELCSRRLALLLQLPQGTQSNFTDILSFVSDLDAVTLERSVDRLRAEGESFETEATLTDGIRRIRVTGVRSTTLDGQTLADMIWVRDVSEGAGMVDDLSRTLHALAGDTMCLKALLDTLPMPVWLRDEDLSLVAVNQTYSKAVETTNSAQVVQDQVELAPDTLVREARAVAARARAAGDSRSENFHLVLGGERRTVQVVETPLAVDGSLLTAGYALDITEQDELRTEIKRHADAHAEVLERLSTAMAIYTTDTRLSFFNTAFVRLWRLDREWLAGTPTYGGVLDTLRERRMLPEVADYRAYKEDELKRFISLIDPVENLLHLPDGRTLRRTVSPHPHGGLIYTYEDVTDSLALERSFNTAMAVQRETLDHLHEGIAVFGGDGRLKLSNPAFARIWNLSADDLAGEPHLNEWLERLKPFFVGRPDRASTWPQVRERLLALVSRRRPMDDRLERQDDSIVHGTAVPLPDGATLLTWLDISDTARVERALIERNDALAAADMLKSEFIANVSTEVAKPLTTIIGFAEMLTDGYFGPLNGRQGEYLSGINLAGQSLRNLISDILDLANIEAGQMRLELDAVDVHPLLVSVLSLIRERVREKKLTLDFQCPLDVGWVVGDRRRLKQVMFNLLVNAIKYTPMGGQIAVSAERNEGDVIFRVADSGVGITADDQKRVFDSFTRVRCNDAQDGAGLGLALVRSFVRLHGGQVDLDSVLGQGTVVTVRLPGGQGAAP